MEVRCPSCASRFNLPDEYAKPGRKLRCSQCANVFALEAPKAAPPPPPPPKPERKASPFAKALLLKLAIILILIAAGVGGGYFYFTSTQKPEPPTDLELQRKVERLTMRNVRQYYVDNEKVGKIFVIEGKVVNEFPDPKSLVTVEGAIYGRDKKPVSVKKQLAGTQLSLFQLQVLNEKEMESFLNNKLEILSNNVNVPSGGEVPFMVLFYSPPQGIVEFGVRIVDVQEGDPKTAK
ncbi:MAG: zinc-ribbon domain-containing protein [Desulfovibrio sp.]|jgi:predicted Zn finger-like uncharacterized protein|nr:zinc-ribbon domain-containing protein [Desulfovibrio sp.]